MPYFEPFEPKKNERITLTPDDAAAISRLLEFALPHVDLATSEVVAAALVAEKLLLSSSLSLDVVLVFEDAAKGDTID